ncbi:MAG: hypothetical protein AAF639_31415 [Chloroflexota bacterium]
MSTNKNLFERLFDEQGNLIHYPYEVLFGDEEPVVDMYMRKTRGRLWRHQFFMPDGVRESDATHTIYNFEYSLNDEIPLIRTMACGIYYRTHQEVDEEDLLTVMVLADAPEQDMLADLTYQPTVYPGIYVSNASIFVGQIIMVLSELRKSFNNWFFKLIVEAHRDRWEPKLRRQEAKEAKAKRSGKSSKGGSGRGKAGRDTSSNKHVRDDHDISNAPKGIHALYSDEEIEPLTSISSDELIGELEAYLEAQLEDTEEGKPS